MRAVPVLPKAGSFSEGPSWVSPVGVGFGDRSGTALSVAEEAAGLGQCFLDTETSTGMLLCLGAVPGKG